MIWWLSFFVETESIVLIGQASPYSKVMMIGGLAYGKAIDQHVLVDWIFNDSLLYQWSD